MSYIYPTQRKLKRKTTNIAYCLYKTKKNRKKEHWTHIRSFLSFEEVEIHFKNLKKHSPSYLDKYIFSLVKTTVEISNSHISPQEMFLLKIKHGF